MCSIVNNWYYLPLFQNISFSLFKNSLLFNTEPIRQLNYRSLWKNSQKHTHTQTHLPLTDQLEWSITMGQNISNNSAALHFLLDTLQRWLTKQQQQKNGTTELNFKSLDVSRLDKCVRGSWWIWSYEIVPSNCGGIWYHINISHLVEAKEQRETWKGCWRLAED